VLKVKKNLTLEIMATNCKALGEATYRTFWQLFTKKQYYAGRKLHVLGLQWSVQSAMRSDNLDIEHFDMTLPNNNVKRVFLRRIFFSNIGGELL
jgi:hypothetical protein